MTQPPDHCASSRCSFGSLLLVRRGPRAPGSCQLPGTTGLYISQSCVRGSSDSAAAVEAVELGRCAVVVLGRRDVVAVQHARVVLEPGEPRPFVLRLRSGAGTPAVPDGLEEDLAFPVTAGSYSESSASFSMVGRQRQRRLRLELL